MIDGFLLGVISTASLATGAIFLKFWRRTRDRLFLAFGAAFVIESVNRLSVLFSDRPGDAGLLMYGVRLIAFALILAAIIGKNIGRRT
jgi:hypothetical protein